MSWRLSSVFSFIHRSIKIRPVSVKTFDEVTMENGTDDNLEVSHIVRENPEPQTLT